MKNNSFGVTKLIVSVLIFHLNRCGAICIFKKFRGFHPRTPASWGHAAPRPPCSAPPGGGGNMTLPKWVSYVSAM